MRPELPGGAAQTRLRVRLRLYKHEADRYAKALRPILIELRHMPVEKIVDELTKRKVATRGGRWHGRTVARLLDRLDLR
jgi:hypothetical protein